ncbi:hypothetical protein Btru_052743 [Bulinus truncatus]|nr:hypothetical protein Btru_052743 [Bulinus truncatus]
MDFKNASGCFMAAVLLVGSLHVICEGYVMGDRRLDVAYKDLGDLNVGGLFSMSKSDVIAGSCKQELQGDVTAKLQMMEVLSYTIKQVNKDSSLLPGIKVGFVFLDICADVHVAMIQARRFLPRSDPMDYTPTNKSNLLTSYKVFGVFGSTLSEVTAPLSSLFGGVGMPVLSFAECNDDLQGNFQSTLIHISPGDYDVASAMMEFLRAQEWLLVSVIIQYGKKNAFETHLRTTAGRSGVCIVDRHYVTEVSDWRVILAELNQSPAKVILVFVNGRTVENLMGSSRYNIDATAKKFIWMLTDSWLYYMQTSQLSPGPLVFSSSALNLPGFETNLDSFSLNPWFWRRLEHLGCHIDNYKNCPSLMANSAPDKLYLKKGDLHDAMMTFVHGLNDLIVDNCPGAEGARAASCFDRHAGKFISYLRNVTFEGVSGKVRFDERGQKVTSIYVYQEVALNRGALISEIKTYRMASPGAALCCHMCHKCQETEIVVHNETACQQCPELHWPSMVKGKMSVCKEITPTDVDWKDPISLAILISDGVGVLHSFILLVLLIAPGDSDGDEPAWVLQILQLLSISWGLVSVPLFMLPQNSLNCVVAHVMYTVSFLVSYKTILLRVLKVYKTSAFVVNEQETWLADSCCVCCFLSILAVMEVAIYCVLSYCLPVANAKYQPLKSKAYVEEVCQVPLPHTVFVILFSCFQLMLCTVISLRSHRDDPGLEHVRYLSTYLLVSLVMWIVYMPAYLIVSQESLRLYFLILTVLVNHNGALLLAFTPRFLHLTCIYRTRASITSSLYTTSVSGKLNAAASGEYPPPGGRPEDAPSLLQSAVRSPAVTFAEDTLHFSDPTLYVADT